MIDLGLVNSSAASTMVTYIIERLRKDGEVEKDISPNLLIRNWPPAFKEWSTKAVRDTFFASPLFPRLLDPEAVKETIARGVEGSVLAYVGKSSTGDYQPFFYGRSLSAQDVEISDDMYIITGDTAESYKKQKEEPSVLASLIISPAGTQMQLGKKQAFVVRGVDQYGAGIATGEIEWKATGGSIDKDGVFLAGDDEGGFIVTATAKSIRGCATVSILKEGPPPPPPLRKPGVLRWSGEVPTQKWMNFYTKVLSRFATGKGLKLSVSFEVTTEGGVSKQNVEETKTALKELGLNDEVDTG